jgi:hypothetical protein
MKRILVVTATAMLLAAPITFAQTQGATPPAPPMQQTQPTTPPDPTSPTQPTPPSTTPPTTQPPTQGGMTPAPGMGDMGQMAEANAEPSCRTRRAEGEQCSCIKVPTDMGVAQRRDEATHNTCMVPRARAG